MLQTFNLKIVSGKYSCAIFSVTMCHAWHMCHVLIPLVQVMCTKLKTLQKQELFIVRGDNFYHSIKKDLWEIGCRIVNWIELARDRVYFL